VAYPLPPAIQSLIEGEDRSRVNTGSGLAVFSSGAGAVVVPLPAGEEPIPALRPLPLRREPPPSPDLLDREAERAAVAAAIAAARPVDLYGAPGVGKTALLRHLAHEAADGGGQPDGVIYLSGRGQPVEDLLRAVFDAFFTTGGGPPFLPTSEQLRQALAARRALVLVDDADLGAEAADTLLAAAPASAFVLASGAARLAGEGVALGLGGLPRVAALALLGRELGRPLEPSEAAEAAALVTAAGGHPLRLLQAAAMVRQGERSLAEARQLLAAAEGDFVAAAIGSLSEPQRRLLAALAAVGGGPLGAGTLGELARVDEAERECGSLLGRRLLESRGRSFGLAPGLGRVLAGVWDLGPWRERALTRFARQNAGLGPPAGGGGAGQLEAALEILGWALEAERYREAIRLARAIEGRLFTGLRWGAWKAVLEGALRAAEAAGDSAAEAWSLHQLGSRALALGDAARGREALAQALALRESLGDEAGVALSRHNLDPGAFVATASRRAAAVPATAPAARASSRPPAPRPDPGEAELVAGPPPPRPPRGRAGAAGRRGSPLDRELDKAAAPAAQLRPERRGEGGEGRGRGRAWLVAAVVALLAGAAAWYFLLRPATVVTAPRAGLDFGEQPLSSTGPPRRATVTSEGPRRLEIASVTVAGDHPEDFPLVDDGCSGRSLARGESCAVEASFAPRGLEARRAALVVASNGAGAPQVIPLAGTGTQPVGSFVPPRLEFGDQKVGSRGAAKEALLVNSGSAPLEVAEVRLSGERGSFVLARDGCSGRSLPTAGDCTVAVAFAPRKEGALAASLEIRGSGLDAPVSARLEGKGTVSRLCLQPASLSFDPQPLGSTGQRALTVSSCGSAPLEVGELTPPAAAGFAVAAQDCAGRTLAAGGHCTVTVRFRPAAEGAAEGELALAAGAAGSPWRVPLRAVGTAAHAAARPAALDFGGRLIESPGDLLRFTVANTGTAPLVLGQLAFGSGEGPFAVTEDGCSGKTLAAAAAGAPAAGPPAAGCEVAVAFRPAREAGYRGELVLPSNAPEGPLRMALAGAGAAPHVAADPETLRFGEQRAGAGSEPKALRIVNTGQAPLQLGGLGIPDSAVFLIDPDRCSGRTLPPGGRCEIGVRFEPQGEGAAEAELRVASNAREGVLKVRLSGTGVVARAALSPPVLELGNAGFGPRAVTVENVGRAALSVDRLVVEGERESFPVDGGDCAGKTLAPGKSCRIQVRFVPSRPGAAEAKLTVVHDGEGPKSVRLTGDAAPPAPPLGLAPGNGDAVQPQPVEGCEGLTLHWQAVSEAWPPVNYDLEVEVEHRNGEWEAVYTSTTPVTEDVLTEKLSRRRSYRWRVRARDGVGNHGAPSEWRYFACVARLE
jgi:hypothetical protein